MIFKIGVSRDDATVWQFDKEELVKVWDYLFDNKYLRNASGSFRNHPQFLNFHISYLPDVSLFCCDRYVYQSFLSGWATNLSEFKIETKKIRTKNAYRR